MSKTKFEIGDMIKRRSNVFDKNSPWMKGTVTKVYSYKSKIHGYYPELYEVEWINMNKIEGGFLPHGLDELINV